MSRWFRFYDDVINDPKVLSLPEAMRWAWVALLCAASKNDGLLPSTDHLALMLRVTKQRAAAVIAALCAAGLIDRTETGFAPHNWASRQYKSDVSTARVKRFRNGGRNAECSVSETPPETENRNREQKDAVADDAGASERGQAWHLAEKLLVIAGHDPAFWPPGWCGAPMRVQTWLNEGWPSETIVSAVTAAAKRKHGAPAASVQFFEAAIAEEIARQAAPIPVVQIREAEKITVKHGTNQIQSGGSLTASLRRDLAELEAQGADPALPARAVFLLSR